MSKLEAAVLNLVLLKSLPFFFVKTFPFVVGEKIVEFDDRNGVHTQVFDLYAENDVLLVPSCNENSVSCYELIS